MDLRTRSQTQTSINKLRQKTLSVHSALAQELKSRPVRELHSAIVGVRTLRPHFSSPRAYPHDSETVHWPIIIPRMNRRRPHTDTLEYWSISILRLIKDCC